jgi:magnesium transporter
MRPNDLNNLSLKPDALEIAKQTANQLEVRELVRSLSELEPKKRVLAFRLLEKSKAIAVFEYLTPDKQADLIREMESQQVTTILEALDPDDRVRLFEELPAKITKRLIADLSPQARDAVNLLLGYPEGTSGRLMSPRYLTVRNHITSSAALASVRESKLRDDELEMVFLIDSERFYRGFIRTVRLIKANPDTPVEMLLDGANVAVRATDSEMQAAQMLKDYDLPAVPVVDNEGRLLGDITFDDVIDVIQEEAAEAALSQAGVGNLIIP